MPRAPLSDVIALLDLEFLAQQRAWPICVLSPPAIREASTPVDLFEYQGKQFFAQYGMTGEPQVCTMAVFQAFTVDRRRPSLLPKNRIGILR